MSGNYVLKIARIIYLEQMFVKGFLARIRRKEMWGRDVARGRFDSTLFLRLYSSKYEREKALNQTLCLFCFVGKDIFSCSLIAMPTSTLPVLMPTVQPSFKLPLPAE